MTSLSPTLRIASSGMPSIPTRRPHEEESYTFQRSREAIRDLDDHPGFPQGDRLGLFGNAEMSS